MFTVRKTFRGGALACLLCASSVPSVALAQGAVPRPVPVPSVSGPVAVTSDSYPFMTASKLIEPIDLATYGYVEEEFFISGAANVYDWAPSGALTVKTADAPYTTRILVRRPADASRFSGNVIVEPLHAPRGHDWALMWGYSYEYILEHHDAWVGISMVPGAGDALKTFNPSRYAPINWANPTPTETCAAGGRGGGNAPPAPSATEEGLRWDMFSQLAALLKSDAPGRPLTGFAVEQVYMSTQDAALTTYIVAVHNSAKLANGRPAYDGYLIKSGGAPGRIRRCAQAPGPGDPRTIIRNISVPVINVEAQGEVLRTMVLRRPDSDEMGDRFRLYEVPAASHMDNRVYRFIPAIPEMAKTGANVAGETPAWPFVGGDGCEPQIPITPLYVMSHTFHAAFMNLDAWVRKGVAPPRAPRIEVTGTGEQARIVVDEYGNARGGVRNPYVDVPVAKYVTNTSGPMNTCRQLGYKVPFEWSQLESTYGGFKSYATKVTQSVDRLVKERWLTESDGRRITRELIGAAAGGTR